VSVQQNDERLANCTILCVVYVRIMFSFRRVFAVAVFLSCNFSCFSGQARFMETCYSKSA
jgi:hypothetical protein